ncbi:carboxyl-terminal processing protease [Lachnospiraceae bacterium NK3A20]|nr:carboxyl-terminal processing protease [Lachnospiraceae bacterium NK3A20]
MEDQHQENNRIGGRKRAFAAGIACGIAGLFLIESLALSWASGSRVNPVTYWRERRAAAENSAINEASLSKLEQLEKSIDQYYYEPEEITKEQKEDGIYKGLLASLDDPYSVYYTADEVKELNESLSGQYYGIGAYLSADPVTKYPRITGVIKGTPAEEAGLADRDIIYKVDDEDVGGLSLDEVVSRVRGEEGTSVHLTIVREDEPDYLEFDVKRAKVDSPTVDGRMLDKDKGIAYLSIAEFDDVTTQQFEEKLKELQKDGMKGLVLDLRGNPGGNVDTVTAIAGYFLPKGLVFYMEDRDGKRTEYETDGTKQLDIPLAVLVNGSSASASEILSGGIQDAGTGTIIGEQTFGKGVVQTVFSLTDGTAVKLTIADYYTRNGHNINKKGVTPDIDLPLDTESYRKDGSDNQLEKAQEVVEKVVK